MTFTGRQQELAVLAAATGVVLVEGEAGVGKTALVERFLASRGGHVLRASGEPAERGIAYGALELLHRRGGPRRARGGGCRGARALGAAAGAADGGVRSAGASGGGL